MTTISHPIPYCRCLWVVLSHILNGNLTRSPTQQVHHTKGLSAESVDLLTAILKEIFSRTNNGKKSAGMRERERVRGREQKLCLLEELYNDSCVVVLARSVLNTVL
jgi:hypothetical protein